MNGGGQAGDVVAASLSRPSAPFDNLFIVLLPFQKRRMFAIVERSTSGRPNIVVAGSNPPNGWQLPHLAALCRLRISFLKAIHIVVPLVKEAKR